MIVKKYSGRSSRAATRDHIHITILVDINRDEIGILAENREWRVELRQRTRRSTGKKLRRAVENPKLIRSHNSHFVFHRWFQPCYLHFSDGRRTSIQANNHGLSS